MGAEWRRGQMSAWLLKKKSGSSIVRVRQYNKRYFTLDFDSRVFFYAHAENSKKVSSIIPFADIVDVQLPESQADRGDNVSECSRGSRVSLFRRLSSFGAATKDTEQEQHVLTVRTRPSKTMELVCSSSFEALQWFEAFKAAIEEGAQGHEEPEDAGETSAGTGPGDATIPPRAAEAASAGNVRALSDHSDESPANPPPKPVCGTFMDLNTEETSATAAGSLATAAIVADESTAVQAAGAAIMQARDFGFADEAEDSDSAAGSDAEPAAGRGRGRHPDSPAGTAGPSVADVSYEDRHKGLSMQERLANMQFSDDEDGSDDDPLGFKSKKADQG